MGSRFHFRFFLFLLGSFFIVFGLAWLSAQKIQVKQKKELLKVKLKGEAFSQMDVLNSQLYFLNDFIDSLLKQIELENLSISNRPHFNLDKITYSGKSFDKSLKGDRASGNSSAGKRFTGKRFTGKSVKNPSVSALFLKIFVFDEQDLKLPLYSQTKEEPELFKALDLENKQKFLSQGKIYFEKMKWKGKSYHLLFQVAESQIVVAFLKKSYFKLDQMKPQAKALFSSFNKNQDRFFYNTNLRDSSKLINTFFKDSSSKYITRKSKKNQTLYYLQEWKGTNLLFVAKKERPLNFFTAFIEKEWSFLLLMSLALFLLLLLFFILYSKLSILFQAYSFLKTALLSYSETGSFPEDSSKNSLLSFYRNRQEILNQITKQDSRLQEEEIQLQELIKQEIKKIKAKYPNLILHEDFQTDIKMFGFQNFFRTIFNELLLNAIESMGAVKEQKIDLSVKEENQQLVLSIKDYGIGLKEPEKAFQIYYSTKSQLGVGLNLVQSIVTANQGQIELFPQEEGGLLAIVRLPLSCFLKK